MTHCPCGSQKNYDVCCEPYLKASSLPQTPEALMRSRYTAYTEGNIDYIARTMMGRAKAQFDAQDAKEFAEFVTFSGLTVLSSHQQNHQGYVEFIAKYSYRGKPQVMHERSEFLYENDRWFYVDGTDLSNNKIGRNDACPCGSEKKYKKCCM